MGQNSVPLKHLETTSLQIDSHKRVVRILTHGQMAASQSAPVAVFLQRILPHIYEDMSSEVKPKLCPDTDTQNQLIQCNLLVPWYVRLVLRFYPKVFAN